VTPTAPRTTLLAIDCRYSRLAARSLHLSLAACGFERAKLLTDDPDAAQGFDPRIELVRIEPLRSRAAYSRFVLAELPAHVDTDFVQIVQWDGYVANGAGWSDEFLEYDYIGSRWHFVKDGLDVGNGGFSLRSRRLLDAVLALGITGDPEDQYICRHHRKALEEQHGIRFAPAEVADRYAFEGIRPTGREFGFHNVFNLPFFNNEASLSRILSAVPDSVFSPPGVSLIQRLVSLKRHAEARHYARRLRLSASYARVDEESRKRLGELEAKIAKAAQQ
jgi:hypothetical protein